MNPFYDLNKRLSDIAAKGEPQALTESAKPDFLDMDKDGNRKESFKQAVKDREKKVAEGGYDPTNPDSKYQAPITQPNKLPSPRAVRWEAGSKRFMPEYQAKYTLQPPLSGGFLLPRRCAIVP